VSRQEGSFKEWDHGLDESVVVAIGDAMREIGPDAHEEDDDGSLDREELKAGLDQWGCKRVHRVSKTQGESIEDPSLPRSRDCWVVRQFRAAAIALSVETRYVASRYPRDMKGLWSRSSLELIAEIRKGGARQGGSKHDSTLEILTLKSHRALPQRRESFTKRRDVCREEARWQLLNDLPASYRQAG
jgi:hypothetical protein